MKSMSFIRGVGIALVLALVSSILFSVLTSFANPTQALRLLIPGVAFAYLLCLLARSRHRTGRITVILLWCVAATSLWLLTPGIGLYLIVHGVLIWAVRSVYRYGGVVCALIDLALTLTSLAAAVWAAQHTGSLFLSVWCLFLTQALFVFIPTQIQKRGRSQPPKHAQMDNFARAQHAADAALRRLSTNN
jgi:hypothetical protein